MATTIEATGGRRRTYLPAAGHDWFLPFYDPLVKLVGGDHAGRALLEQAGVRSGQRVLDVGWSARSSAPSPATHVPSPSTSGLCGAMPRPLREETKQELTARERAG